MNQNQNKFLLPKNVYRPTWIEIHHDRLRENFFQIRSLLPKKVSVLSVVKANAYGHGLLSVSRTLSRCGTRFFGVTSLEEALQLRSVGITTPPLILGNIFPFSNLKLAIQNGIRVTIASQESAWMCHRAALRMGKRVYAHAKIDTGMNRIGVHVDHGMDLIQRVLSYPTIRLEGLYTHFSGSAENRIFTQLQLEKFTHFVNLLIQEGISIPYIHCANSAAILKYPSSHFSLVRPGISLYGVCTVGREKRIHLQPVLSWKSRIVFLKTVPSRTPISYAGTFKTKRTSKIATIAFGYADGYRRSLSNKGVVLVQGRRVPVVGRVTMDMTMVDVTDLPQVEVGDEVVLIGQQGNASISIEEVAGWCGTSPYEIFCGIAARVPRIDIP